MSLTSLIYSPIAEIAGRMRVLHLKQFNLLGWGDFEGFSLLRSPWWLQDGLQH